MDGADGHGGRPAAAQHPPQVWGGRRRDVGPGQPAGTHHDQRTAGLRRAGGEAGGDGTAVPAPTPKAKVTSSTTARTTRPEAPCSIRRRVTGSGYAGPVGNNDPCDRPPEVLPRRRPGVPGGLTDPPLVLAVVLVVLASAPEVYRYLVSWPQDQWQVDVEVYREAGARSSTAGRSTRPDRAAAAAAVHLSAVRRAAGHAARADPVRRGGLAVDQRCRSSPPRPSSGIAGPAGCSPGPALRPPLALAVLTARCSGCTRCPTACGSVRSTPSSCSPASSTWRSPPAAGRRGVLVGLATAVKLTPGRVPVYYLRRTGAGARRPGRSGSAVAAHHRRVLPSCPRRRSPSGAAPCRTRTGSGPNGGTSNQSIRGVLLRLGPAGRRRARRCGRPRRGRRRGAGSAGAAGLRATATPSPRSAAMGLIAVLLSPVAWIHHLAWLVVVIAAPWSATGATVGAWSRGGHRRVVPVPAAVVGRDDWLSRAPPDARSAAVHAERRHRSARWPCCSRWCCVGCCDGPGRRCAELRMAIRRPIDLKHVSSTASSEADDRRRPGGSSPGASGAAATRPSTAPSAGDGGERRATRR